MNPAECFRHNQEKNMKTTNKFLLSAFSAAALFSLAVDAQAQYRATGEDGITASPRSRATLNERKTIAASDSTSPKVVGYQARGEDGIVASPRMRAMLMERQVAPGVASDSARIVSHQPVGEDGIAASPRLRQTLNEKRPTFQVAPLK